jgi:nucleotide-binding universal stress UspA family protein
MQTLTLPDALQHPYGSAAPVKIVVACDFTDASNRAAQAAVELAAPGATVYLVHVARHTVDPSAPDAWYRNYTSEADEALLRLSERLEIPAAVTITGLVLHGDPVSELRSFASSVGADLVVTGKSARRLMFRSVATRLARRSPCSVLVVNQ